MKKRVIMNKWITENIESLIKNTRYYFAFSIAIFLVLGSNEFGGLIERFVMVFGVIIGYLMFFNFVGVYFKMQSKMQKYSWEKVKKILRLQANFFIVFGYMILFVMLLSSMISLEMIPLTILASNISIGLILGTTRAKLMYGI
jgi:magnesium-transporting ATPase (P-type)